MTAWRKGRAVLRPEVVARAVALSADTRRGVLVVGPPGAGASRCAADIAAGLRAAGVLVETWDDLDRVTPGGAARGTAPRVVPAGAVVVASARLGAPLPPGYHDEVGVRTTRLPLRSLTRAEAESTVSEAVGHPLSARLVEVLWACSHGNVAALRATYDDLAARGLVRRSRDRLDLTVDPGTAIADVRVDPRLWIDDTQVDPAITAALARRIRVDDLVDLHGDDAVVDLIARGVLATDRADGVEMLTVQPPVLAAALRAGADHRRRRAVYEAVLSRSGSPRGGSRAQPDPRIVLWALENAPGPADRPDGAYLGVVATTVLTAARAALAGHDYLTVIELYEAAHRFQLGMSRVQHVELALLAASGLRSFDRVAEAAVMLERTQTLLQGGGEGGSGELGGEGDDDDEVIRLLIDTVAARADLAHYLDRHPENALQLIDRAHDSLPVDHSAHAVLGALTVVHLSYSGRYTEAARAYESLVPSVSSPQVTTPSATAQPLPAEWQRRMDAVHALALDAVGRSDDALALLRRLARRTRTMNHQAWASEEYLSALLSVVLHGYGVTALLAELAPFIATEQDASVRLPHGMRRVADAEIALAAGDLDAALSAAADAVDALEVDGPEDFLPRAISLHALACALTGKTSAARDDLTRLRAVHRYTNSPVGPEIRASEAGVLSCLGETDSALDMVRALAEEGLHGAAARAALPGVLMGDERVCGVVGELTVTGDVPVLVTDLAAAVLARNPRQLLGAASRAREYGLVMLAAGAADRARALASPGSHYRVLAERMLASTGLSAPPAGLAGPGGAAGALPPGVTLTRRETEIADLVGRGLTNAEIAADLHLSKRTVEGHLNRIYTKTGTRLRG